MPHSFVRFCYNFTSFPDLSGFISQSAPETPVFGLWLNLVVGAWGIGQGGPLDQFSREIHVKRLNDECRLKAIKEKAEAKGAKDARRASELNRRQAESGALVEALSVIRTLVGGRAEKPTRKITLEPDSQNEPDEGSDFEDS